MKTYKLNGKIVTKKQIKKDYKLVRVVNEEHYETNEYTRQQSINSSNFFNKLREQREDLEERHG